jgi:hypothetical protein
MKVKLAILLILIPLKGFSYFIHLENMTEGEFSDIAEEFSVLSTLSATGGFDTIGWKGFSLSAEVIGMDITPRSSHWKNALNGKRAPDILPVLRFEIEKGLPYSFDAGLHITSLPGSQMDMAGLWIEYEIMKESIFRPSLSIRSSLTSTIFAESPHIYSVSVETGVSKRKAGFFYYAGFGTFYSKANAVGFDGKNFVRVKGRLGITFLIGAFTLTFQADISSIFLYTVGCGMRFYPASF